jgi:hypothetical protein
MPELGLVISVVSIVIAFVALHRTSRYQREHLQIQKRLADLQLEAASSQKARAVVADVRAALEGGGGRWRVVIRNAGPGLARNVTLRMTGEHDPILRSEYDAKLPIPELPPGDEVSLIAAITMSGGRVFDCELAWNNEDGSPGKRATRLTLP